MQVLLLFVSLAIWCSAAEEASDPYYLVTVSADLAYPSERKVCVVLSHLNCAVNLKLEFVTEDLEVKLLVEDKTDEPEYSQCYSFQVPDPTTNYADWDFRVSINGDNVNISESTKVFIYKGHPTIFVQTDKPLYKPGQTVKFRVVNLDEDLYARNETISMVEIKDSNKNQIAQWRDVKPVKGITDFSFHLADEVPSGDYSIIISHKTTRTFSVTEYELKNFEVDINIPDAVHGKDNLFPLEVCARYTFGKPVHGFMKICVCISNTNPLDDAHYDDQIEHSDCQCFENLKTDNKGCFSKDVDLDFFNLATKTYIRYLTISTAVKEHGTGRVEKTSTILQIGSPKMMSFVDVDIYYHKGIAYNGMLYVVDNKKKPKANVKVFLIVNNDDAKTNISLVTNEKGIAGFSLDTSDWEDRVSVTGVFDLEDDSNDDLPYNPAFRWLNPFYSASNSFLKLQKIPEKFPCDVDQPIKVKYSISKNDLNPDSQELKIFYLFVSYGIILSSGEHMLNVKGETSDSDIRGSFSIYLKPKQNSHSYNRLLVYTLLKNGAVTGDQALYRISMCFKHKVKLEFSDKEVHPRGKVQLDITADPGSMCSVRSVDKGLLLVKSHDQLIDNSDDDFEYETFWWENWQLFDFFALQDTQTCSENDPDSEVSDYSSESRLADMSTMFLVSYILLMTNAKVHKPVSCPVSEFSARSSGPQTAQSSSHSHRRPKKPITRRFIPETWIFDLVSLGDDGHTQLPLTTSDAITNWETDAFCLSNAGYGRAQKVQLKTIQPFFIELVFPHSVLQGENFKLTAHVFNYLENCVVVGAWLSESEDFIAVMTTRGNTSCICPDQSDTFTWNITVWMTGKFKLKVSAAATRLEAGCPEGEVVLGNKDIEDSLEKTITVKPGGVKNDVTKTYRLCPEGGSVRQKFVLKLPEYLVPGSEYAELTVFGDILSNAVFNSEDIIDLPTGCGEQNIARFAVNLELYLYLRKSNQLTLEVKNKLLKHLTTGYQKQLSFRNENGSYSIFPDDKGNIWLTAKVVREFSQAKDFIHINKKDIQESLKWLSSAQLPSGCFQRHGDYFNRWQEDEEHEDVRLAAFIAIALMESGAASELEKKMLQTAMTFLKTHINDVKDISTEAVLAYAFTLSGDGDLRKHLLEDLEKEAKHTDLYTHWEDEFISGGNIETSAYVALSLLTHQPTSKDIEEATKIINWIVSKQDSRGGYYSTPDTVLALQALSKFAVSAVIQKGDVSVSIHSRSGFQKDFVVDKDQGVLLQKVSLPDITREYVVTVTGGPCVYVQTHLHYYVPVVENETHFALNVSTEPTSCTYKAHTSLQVVIELSYTGTRVSSNMVIVEVKLMSGFKANKNNLAKLLQNLNVKRTEIKDETVILYLDKVTHDKLSFEFSVTQETFVDNLQPATVLVYDYYEPEQHAAAEYISPCHTGGEVCYPFIGCFSSKKPWTGTGGRFVRSLPWSPKDIDIRFLLHTRQNPGDFQVINAFDASSISASNFNSSKKSHFIIHGFRSTGEMSWLIDMCTAILSVEDVNCFCVDWDRGAHTFFYSQAVNNVRVVGAVTAYFIETLVDTTGCSLSDVYLIGHSLGAQAAGEAGKRRPGISRITGLDPAGPYFEGTPPEVRLDRTDAKLVDVIHTDGSSILTNVGWKGYGTSQLLGHLDFFPNGGKQMKGCGFSMSKIFRPDLLWQDSEDLVACHHLRSYKYFTESVIHPDGFVGFPADSYDEFQLGAGFPCPITGCPLMGYHADAYTGITSEHQVFYLNTATDPPYTSWRYKILVKAEEMLSLFQGSTMTIHGSLGDTDTEIIHKDHLIAENTCIMFMDVEIYVGNITKMVFNFQEGIPDSLPTPLTRKSVSIQSGKDGTLYKFCGGESLQGNTLTIPFC